MYYIANTWKTIAIYKSNKFKKSCNIIPCDQKLQHYIKQQCQIKDTKEVITFTNVE